LYSIFKVRLSYCILKVFLLYPIIKVCLSCSQSIIYCIVLVNYYLFYRIHKVLFIAWYS